MILRETIEKILLEDLALQLQQLRDKYVGEGKPMTEEDFIKIQDVANNKFNYIAWLSKRVGTGIIKAEDVYKYKEYFEIFEKNKKKFTHKDINLYKTAEDLEKFLGEVFNVREGDIVFDEIVGKDNFVSKNEIEKLESTGGAKYLGIFENKLKEKIVPYQVFQIYGVNQQTWKLYRDILGKCKGRARGARIDICTIGSYQYFKQYLKEPKGSSYFLLYNLDDPKSPYQLHYESGQFMDKNDSSRIGIDHMKFFEFVGNRVPRYSLDNENFPGEFEVPVKDKGTLDDKKRKQGLWKYSENGKMKFTTFVNNKPLGPFVHYFPNGVIDKMGSFGPDEVRIGKYESNYADGKIHRKGNFDNSGQKIGMWIIGDEDGFHRMIDYDKKPIEITGVTKDDKVRYVSFSRDQDTERYYENPPYGNTIFFNPTGTVNAMGRLGTDYTQLGNWTYFFSDGSIKSEGKFLRGRRQGVWTDVLKTKDGKKYIFVADFYGGWPKEKIKIYDENGVFYKKKSPDKLKKAYWRDMRPDTRSFKFV